MNPPYTPPPAKPTWFLQRKNWLLFMIRELTSAVIALYLVFFLVFLARLGAGAEAFEDLLASLTHPLAMAAHALAFAASVWHAVSWFNTSAQVMPIRIGTWRMPRVLTVIITGYAPWIILSALVLWAALP